MLKYAKVNLYTRKQIKPVHTMFYRLLDDVSGDVPPRLLDDVSGDVLPYPSRTKTI